MGKAEYRSAVRSRKLINEALADLLSEKSLDKITVTDVVTRAGLNRGTFYAHYENVPDVIDHLIQQTFSRIRDAICDPAIQTRLPGALLGQVQLILEEDLDFYRKVMNSSAAPLLQEQLVAIILEYLLQQEDMYPFFGREQYGFMVRFCAGGLSLLYRDWFAGKLPMTLDQLTEQAEKLVSDMIARQL